MQIITNNQTTNKELNLIKKDNIYISCPNDLSKTTKQTKTVLFIKDESIRNQVMKFIGEGFCYSPSKFEITNTMEIDEIEDIIYSCKPIPIKGLYKLDDFEQSFIDNVLKESKMGLPAGWDNLDNLFRVRKKEMTIITGYPNCGKSQFLDNIMVNLAELHDWKFGICSFENSKEEHLKYLLQKHAKKPSKEAMQDTSDYRKYRDFLNNHFMFIKNDEDGLTIDDVLDISGKAVNRYGLHAIVVDPYNWLEGRDYKQSETEYISIMLTKVQRFAKQNNVHVFFVAHPTKHETTGRNTRPPLLNDISGGAHWNNKADVGITVHRDRNEDYEYTNFCKVIVSKVRHKESGKTGQCYFEYINKSGCYTQSNKLAYEEQTQTTPKKSKWEDK